MKKTYFLPLLLLSISFYTFVGCSSENDEVDDTPRFVMIVHGGASSSLTKENLTTEKKKKYTEKLTEALQAGYDKIKSGHTSIDAVQAAINVMEDAPLFNAGKGAVFTHDGKNEMDAAIMNGANLQAGAVADVTIVKNPIDAARAVLEQSKHVMLSGTGAEHFAKEVGCTIVDTSYFYTERRWKSLQRALRREKKEEESKAVVSIKEHGEYEEEQTHFGTVGCVALDQAGNIAAGTSTGGLTNKKDGRIGDSPIIGAGTYANNKTAGISCTGQGEYFMREVAAYRVSALMELKGLTIDQAAKQVIEEIGDMGGSGGMIGLDAKGNVTMSFNTSGMYRGTIDEKGRVKIYFF